MTDGATTFSIVTPSFNQGAYLAETIESVLGQEGDFRIDYLVIDGGSADDSVEIIRQYDLRLKTGEWPVNCLGITFRWLSEPDAGQTDALVKGFARATGSVFAWLNSDDTYLPGALQAADAALRAAPGCALVYGDARYVEASGAAVGNYRCREFDLLGLASANIICQPAAFFRREAYLAVGGLDATLRYVMDYDLWIRIGSSFTCRHVAGTFATYRLHESSKTVSGATLVDNAEESLLVTLRHFGWAPLTRVYTACSIRVDARLPRALIGRRFAIIATAVVCTVIRSLRLNRGVDRRDLTLFNRENFRKLFRNRIDIMTGGTP